jgi:hypothetical protein
MSDQGVYSISLVADGETQQKLFEVVATLGKEFEGPGFDPHITVVPDITGNYDDLNQKVSLALRTIHYPLKITFKGPIMGKEFYRCVYMLGDIAPEMTELYRVVREPYKMALDFYPHLSLFYGEIDQVKTEKVAQKARFLMTMAKLMPLAFSVSKAVIYDVGPYVEGAARVRQWKRAGEVTFNL